MLCVPVSVFYNKKMPPVPDFREHLGAQVTGRLSPPLVPTDVSGGFSTPPALAVRSRGERGGQSRERWAVL